MDTLVGAGPRAELLAVVGVDDDARTLVGSRAKLLHGLAHVAEGNEVAELHAPGEDDEREALVFGDVRLAQLLRTKAGLKEVLVIEDRVGDARLGEQRREVRLPHALGQPGAQRALSEDRVNTVGKRPNLTDAVAPRHSNQNGLVVATGKELDLAPADEVRDVPDHIRAVGFQPVEERPGEVETGLYFGVPIETGHKRGIRPLGHILEH